MKQFAQVRTRSSRMEDGSPRESWQVTALRESKICPQCGVLYRPQFRPNHRGTVQAESRVVWVARVTCSKSCAKKLKNPMHSQEVRQKMSTTLRKIGHKPKVHGGNGSPLSVPQQRLLQILGEGWSAEFIVPTGQRRAGGLPSHYKIDLASPSMMVAIEVDGGSHYSTKVREADARKTAFLGSRGWSVFRVKNAEAMRLSTTCTSPGTLLTSLMGG